MRPVMLCLAALGLLTTIAAAQPREEIPGACRPNANGVTDHQACLEAAAPGSAARQFALINLGTRAVLRGDYATAVRYYDQAQPASGQIYSDASFHSFRADVYRHVGRSQEALADARVALAILQGSPTIPAEIRAIPIPPEFGLEPVYVAILPILKEAGDPGFESGLRAYRAIPAKNWVSYARRASLLEQLGDFAGALEANAQALAQQSAHPGLLSNQCYILTRMGRADEGLPFCERARQAAPGEAPTHHSYAAALAGAGQCSRAEQELAEARRLDPVSVAYREPLPCTPRDP